MKIILLISAPSLQTGNINAACSMHFHRRLEFYFPDRIPKKRQCLLTLPATDHNRDIAMSLNLGLPCAHEVGKRVNASRRILGPGLQKARDKGATGKEEKILLSFQSS